MQLVQNSTLPRDDSATIGTTAVDVVNQATIGGQPTVIFLTNTSTGGQQISLAVGKDAVAGKGIILYPGGIHQETLDSAFLPTPERISAVSSAAGGTLAIHYRLARWVK